MKIIFMERSAIYAWLFFVFIALLGNFDENSKKGFQEIIIWNILGILSVTANILIMRYFTNGAVKSKKSPYHFIPMRAWGYIWRCFLALIPAVITAGIIIRILPPLSQIVVITILSIMLFGVYSFLFFCKEKRVKIQFFIEIVRGY